MTSPGEQTPTYVEQGKEFARDMSYVPDRITRDGRTPEHGPTDGQLWPVEPGRYRLVAAKACPWANRAIIVRKLLGLEDVISLGMPGPTHDKRSWTFDLDPGGRDPVLGIERLQEAYFARFPDYPRGITVPAMVDVPTGQLVTNDFPWITHDLFFEWREFHRAGRPRPVAGRAPRRDGGRDEAGLHRGQQRRLPLRLRRFPGGVRRRLRTALGRARLARGAARPGSAT